jgi:hypothetical protein
MEAYISLAPGMVSGVKAQQEACMKRSNQKKLRAEVFP